MSLVDRINARLNLRAEASGTPGPTDAYWYSPIGYGSASGMRVTPDSAMRQSAVLSCVYKISRAMSVLPLTIRKKRTDGGSDPALNHPVYDLLAHQPNSWQTSAEFIQLMSAHVELRGNAYAEIIPGPRGDVDQLIPMHPDRVTPERNANGYVRYRYRDPLSNQTRILVQGEVFHLRNLSLDGLTGLSTIELAVDTVGVGLAAQDYTARFFENDARPGGVIENTNFKDKEAEKAFRENWQKSQTGENRHKTAIMPLGLTYKELGVKNSDAQLIESRKFTRAEIADLFGIPAHMMSASDEKASTYASSEVYAIQFVTDCLLPRCRMWEMAVRRDLIQAPVFFAKFNVAARLRGDVAARGTFYQMMLDRGVFSPNDVLELEDRNRRDGGDFYMTPLSVRLTGPDAPKEPAPSTEPKPAQARLKMLADSAAERCVRKEVSALAKIRERNTNGNFAAAVTEFYGEHAKWLAETLKISETEANAYCVAHSQQAIDAEDFSQWCAQLEADSAHELARLATEVIQ